MVLDNPDSAVGLVQAVLALYGVSIAVFVLLLEVVSVGILDLIRVLVLGMGLERDMSLVLIY